MFRHLSARNPSAVPVVAKAHFVTPRAAAVNDLGVAEVAKVA